MPPFCDYNAGILDVSEHSTLKLVEEPKNDAWTMMNSPLHNSDPIIKFDLQLLDAVAREEKPKKAVTFADYDEIHEITHLKDMERRDIDAMYLSAEEQAASRSDALDELMAVMNNLESQTGEQVCIRGLENQTLENIAKFREVVEKLYDIVYECQTFEDENDVKVPEEYLAQHLIQVSEQCAVEAQVRAMQDAKEANALLQGDSHRKSN
jgi:hypothetical protein